MREIELTPDEKTILRDYKDKAPHLLVRKKAEAILFTAAGVKPAQIAEVNNRKESTVRQWLREWNQIRLASVVTGHAGNLNASKLSAQDRQEVCEVLSQPPSAKGVPAQFWSVPTLKSWLSTKFDVQYCSPSSYHFLLRFAGLSFHKPAPFDKRRPPEHEVNQRMQQIRAEIDDAVKDPHHRVYAADEVRLDQEAVIHGAWYRKGHKTKLMVNRKRQAQSYIGFLNQNTGECELYALDWQDGEAIVQALMELVERHPDEQITIVWDNAAWHRARVLRDKLGKGNPLERVRLIWMPPYCPDKNPIEHVWKDAKQNIANFQHATFEHTTQAFEDHINSRTFNYKI